MGRLFGTDGIRGLANRDLSIERASGVGVALAMVLRERLGRRPAVLIGTKSQSTKCKCLHIKVREDLNMSKGKKIALMVTMVLVLVAAAVLNVTLLAQNNGQASGDDVVQTGFFATSRADRQATRSYEIAELNAILAVEGDEYAEARQKALQQKQDIVNAMETELLLETLLKAQGFDDVLVTVNAASDNVSVIVDKDELTREDTVRIYNIVATEASVEPDYVKILSV